MFRQLCLALLVITLTSGAALAQGVFLERGQTAVLVEANAGFTENNYVIGFALGLSVGSYIDLGLGLIHAGRSGGEGKIGFAQSLSLNVLRQTNAAGTVFSFSLVEAFTAISRQSYYLGGRAVWQTRPAGNRAAPFVGYGWQDILSDDRESYSVFELGISLIRSGRSGTFVISPSVGFGGDVTVYAVSFMFNLFSGGEASKGHENTYWGD